MLALAVLAAAIPAGAAAASRLSRVDVFAGTRPGPGTFGGGHNYPGAAAPFGMVQWSPDTTPAAPHSGGYDYRDHHVSGFSLTHLSGAGCAVYGDFPFLPTTEPLHSSPAPRAGPGLAGRFQPGFSHASERAEPGFYSSTLRPRRGGAIGVELTATTRTGSAELHFPKSAHASVLIDAGGSAQPDDRAEVHLDPGRREVTGSASSGLFCGQRPRYRVYFAAVFDRPFAASGAWERGRLMPGATDAGDATAPAANPSVTARAGAYATFDTRRRREVGVRVGVSFVSVAGARRNLDAESRRAGFGAIHARARAAWRAALGRIAVSGGSGAQLDTFYTALYHALLAPRTFSDVGGSYIGMDGRVHHARGRVQYADFSGWDVYRTEIPLLALLVPDRAGDIVSSLLADAAQSGCLPRWPYANGQSMTEVGDSADPMIAAAAAFGADRFDHRAALEAMLRGATERCSSPNGEYVERQGLDSYLRHGWVAFDEDTGVRNDNSIYGDPDAVWGSAATSLEYAVDDFAISQFAARHAGDAAVYRAFVHRGANWRHLFEPRAKMIEAALCLGRLPASLRRPPRRRLRRGRRGPVHVDGAPGSRRADPPARRPGAGDGAARPLPPRPQRRRRRDPHRPRPARRRADPGDALALRLAAAALEDPRRRCGASCASTGPRPPAIPATTTSGRSRPPTSSGRWGCTRRSPGPATWRWRRRSSTAPKSSSPTAGGC